MENHEVIVTRFARDRLRWARRGTPKDRAKDLARELLSCAQRVGSSGAGLGLWVVEDLCLATHEEEGAVFVVTVLRALHPLHVPSLAGAADDGAELRAGRIEAYRLHIQREAVRLRSR